MRTVGWIGIVATLAMMAVCSYFNWAYQQTRGHGFEAAMAFGAAAVVVDLFKSILPLSIMRAWDESRYGGMILPSLGFAFCFSCSIVSEFGFLEHNRGAVANDRETVALQYQAATKELADSEARLRTLGNTRPVLVIQEALRGQRVDRLWTTSSNCEEPSSAAERQFCKSFFTSKAELANSVEAAQLGKKIDELKTEVVRLKKDGGDAESDQLAKLMARLLPWLGLDQVTLGVSALFPLTFEFLAAFGLTISKRLMPAKIPPAKATIDGQAEELVSEVVQQAALPPQAQRQIPLRPMRFGRGSDGSIIIDD
jgi:hypothetical protein